MKVSEAKYTSNNTSILSKYKKKEQRQDKQYIEYETERGGKVSPTFRTIEYTEDERRRRVQER